MPQNREAQSRCPGGIAAAESPVRPSAAGSAAGAFAEVDAVSDPAAESDAAVPLADESAGAEVSAA
jgi:hypothetical protein